MRSPFLDHRIDRRQLTRSNSLENNLFQVLVNDFFQVIPGGIPTITISSFSASRISNKTGKNESIVTFTSDMNITAWEARATTELQIPNKNVGLIVGSGGALNAGSPVQFDVDDIELTEGNREYKIVIYAQANGEWY